MKSIGRQVFAGFLFAAILFGVTAAVVWHLSDPARNVPIKQATIPAPSVVATRLNQEQKAFLSDLSLKGWINAEPQYRQVYVNPTFWTQMDYQVKEKFGHAAALLCSEGKDQVWAKLLDKKTGKKLADYSETDGLVIQ